MRIAKVDITPFEADFRGGPYVMSYVTQHRLHTRIVQLTTESGVTGLGEIVRRPSLDRADAEAAEDARLSALEGATLDDIHALLDQWFTQGALVRGLIFGVETALLDLRAKLENRPFLSRLGGALQDDVPLYHSISAADPQTMAKDASAHRKAPVLQPKLGIDGIDADIARLRAILRSAAPNQRILADFNGAYTLPDALRLTKITDPRLMWEDPCLSYADNCAFAQATDTPVMADMCMSEPEDYARAASDGHLAAVAIKPAFTGGLARAQAAMQVCEHGGLLYRIDGPWCGPIAASAVLDLARTAAPTSLYCAADLTAPLDIAPEHVLRREALA